MIQGTVADEDNTLNTDWVSITAEQLSKPSGKILLENILKHLQSDGHKVLVFGQMVCVLDFLEGLLHVKHSKYERINGLNSASHQAGAIHQFFHMSYQSFFMILRKIEGGLWLDSPAADTNVIFDNERNQQLRTPLSPLYVQQQW